MAKEKIDVLCLQSSAWSRAATTSRREASDGSGSSTRHADGAWRSGCAEAWRTASDSSRPAFIVCPRRRASRARSSRWRTCACPPHGRTRPGGASSRGRPARTWIRRRECTATTPCSSSAATKSRATGHWRRAGCGRIARATLPPQLAGPRGRHPRGDHVERTNDAVFATSTSATLDEEFHRHGCMSQCPGCNARLRGMIRLDLCHGTMSDDMAGEMRVEEADHRTRIFIEDAL